MSRGGSLTPFSALLPSQRMEGGAENSKFLSWLVLW